MLRIAASICFILAGCQAALAQGWRGIVPLHSTCEDVKRALGISKCDNKTFELEDASVSLKFSDGTCASEWKVPTGTVLSIDVRPKPAMKLVDLRLEPGKYKRIVDQQDPNLIYYKNYHQGLNVVALADGIVDSLSYGPTGQDESLRCSNESEGQGETASWKTDEYGSISPQEEQARLKQFALRLKAEPNINGYIIGYGGRRSWPGEARDRAECAKNYLTKSLGIEARRLGTIDGGFHEQPLTELYVNYNKEEPPTPFPTVDRNRVEITRERRTGCKAEEQKPRQNPQVSRPVRRGPSHSIPAL